MSIQSLKLLIEKSCNSHLCIISLNLHRQSEKKQKTSSKTVSDASTQAKESSHQLAKKNSGYSDHKDDLKKYVIGDVDLKRMGKGQLLQAFKNLVETPYYKLDSVIYKVRKELENLDYSQDDKLVGTNIEMEQVCNLIDTYFIYCYE